MLSPAAVKTQWPLWTLEFSAFQLDHPPIPVAMVLEWGAVLQLDGKRCK